jgi:hypothetical protein
VAQVPYENESPSSQGNTSPAPNSEKKNKKKKKKTTKKQSHVVGTHHAEKASRQKRVNGRFVEGYCNNMEQEVADGVEDDTHHTEDDDDRMDGKSVAKEEIEATEEGDGADGAIDYD